MGSFLTSEVSLYLQVTSAGLHVDEEFLGNPGRVLPPNGRQYRRDKGGFPTEKVGKQGGSYGEGRDKGGFLRIR